MKRNRIVSLIASSTETICSLGYESQLVGRSHECDFPSSIRSLPVCSEPKFDIDGTSKEIDDRVQDTLKNALSVYRTHVDVLEHLAPSVIVTQDHCEVCAVSLKDVEMAVCEILTGSPEIVSLAPDSLQSVFDGMVDIARSLGDRAAGLDLVDSLKARMAKVGQETRMIDRAKPKVVCIEWIDPLMVAGNWMPELVSIAGGVDVLGPTTSHSKRITVEELVEADPDVIVVMPCGWGIEKGRSEVEPFLGKEGWRELRAVRENRLFYTDGNSFFNRPGPRLVESVEILAEIMFPKRLSYGHEGTAWQRA